MTGHRGATSLALARRQADPLFASVFVGRAIDVGGGPDALTWPTLTDVIVWDLPNDAHDLGAFADGTFDVAYTSHCLEHVADPMRAVAELWRVTRPGGHVVIVVPDWQLYERGYWPSRYNSGHRWRFTTARLIHGVGDRPADLLSAWFALVPMTAEVRSFRLLDAGFELGAGDQTADGSCECGIEIVVRKLPGGTS